VFVYETDTVVPPLVIVVPRRQDSRDRKITGAADTTLSPALDASRVHPTKLCGAVY